MSDGDPELVEFVRQAERTLDGGELSAANTELRIVLPLLKTLGWNVHGPEVVADHPVSLGDGEASESEKRDEAAEAGATDSDGDDAPETGDDATATTDAEGDGLGGDGDEVVVDYALTLDGRPAVLVVTDATDTPLSSAHGRRLGAAMDAADVERGLATNGRSFVFVDAEDGDLREVSCGLADLPERASLLSLYTKRAARERLSRRLAADRQSAAERLRERRETTVEAVEEALVGEVDGPIAGELATAAESLVDGAIDALDAGEHPAAGDETGSVAADSGGDHAGGTQGTHTANGESAAATGGAAADESAASAGGAVADKGATATDGAATDESTDERAATTGATTGEGDGATAEATSGQGATEAADADTRETDPRDEAAPMSRNDGADEYVVRFFDERSSVSAVGNETSGGCVAQAVGYLVHQHALDNRLDLPWAPDGDVVPDGLAVVNREPVHPDGESMQDPVRVANGYHVETAIEPPVAREAVESLAERTGLRVMFQGKW